MLSRGLLRGLRANGFTAGALREVQASGSELGACARGLRTSTSVQGGGGSNADYFKYEWKWDPPEQMPRRANEDQRKIDAVNRTDAIPETPINLWSDVGYHSIPWDQTHYTSQMFNMSRDDTYWNMFVGFTIPVGGLLFWIYYARTSVRDGDRRHYVPRAELPYYKTDFPAWYLQDAAFRDHLQCTSNEYVDYKGKNPFLDLNYKPGHIPTLEEAYGKDHLLAKKPKKEETEKSE